MIEEIGLIFVFAGIIAFAFKLLKQPMIPAYVLAGLVVGPLIFGFVQHTGEVSELSEIAVVVMLFVIGIEMDISRLRKLGLVAIGGGLLQVAACFGLGFGAARLFGMDAFAAAYLGFATAFSSTMVTVKILGDKGDLDSLYGRISVGILIMQDILAIFALSLLTVDTFSFAVITKTFTAAAGLILIIVLVCGRWVLPRLMKFVARDRETMFCVVMGILFIAGFYAKQESMSLSIGSFLAGLAMARLAYQHEIIGHMKALKFFFTVLFFAALGLGLSPSAADLTGGQGIEAFYSSITQYSRFMVIFGILAIALKPLVVILIVSIFGYERSTAFETALSLGQLSEFSLVLVAQGIATGRLEPGLLPPMIIVTVLSMTVSSYLMKYSLALYRLSSGSFSWLSHFSFVEQAPLELANSAGNGYEVALIGCDRIGRFIELALRAKGARYIVVDLNPDVISRLKEEGVPHIFGDIGNHEVLEELGLKNLKAIISTMPDNRDNEMLLHQLREVNPHATFIGISPSRSSARDLYDLGACIVIIPYMLAANQLAGVADDKDIDLNFLLGERGAVRERGARHREELARAADSVVH